ncbi:MAG: ATP-binding protein [Candidatus Aminicenantes bacterium]|nr:ATP-binding protein [Candidatus Aminicenantes bacterium]
MLGLRQKISLGFSALLIIIIVIGTQSILHLSKLGVSIDVILRENYRSVIACQQMKEALERIDSGTLFVLLGHMAEGNDLIRSNRAAFEKSLQVELSTITLPGEGEKAARLRDLFRQYETLLKGVIDPAQPAGLRNQAYFTDLLPLFGRIKDQADEILQLNQQNMSDANDGARRSAESARRRMYVLLSVGTALAVVFILLTRRWILRPIHRLIRSADEIRRGNLDLVVAGGSRDEIGHLSDAFNAMAASLREFRRTDQAKLLRIQKATQQAFDSLPDAIAVIDTEGRVEIATESARTVFGLKPGVLVGDLPFGWMSDLCRDARQDGRAAFLEGQRSIQQFVTGEERYYRPEAVPILDNERLTNGVILVLKDVTQLRQQDEIKRGVVRTVSHQLNTPLTSVRMAIHLLLGEKIGALNEKQAELLMTAREDSDRLHDILTSLLDLSRFESGKAQMDFRALSPRTIILEAVESCRRTAQDRGVALHADIPGDLPDVWVDTTRIGHVFGNLLSNALKHTSPGGRIALTAEADDAWIRFHVSDTGEGIPAAFLTRVFEPFFRVPGRRNETGAGLGLAIVKEIVEAHGGTVGVENGEGKGSTFTFTLRRADRFPKEKAERL